MITSQNLYIVKTVLSAIGEPVIGLIIIYSIKTSEEVEVDSGTLTELGNGRYELKKTLDEGQYRISYTCEGYAFNDDVVECYNISQINNLDEAISTRASQQSLDDKTIQYISIITAGINKKIYYSEEKISVIRDDTNTIIFNFKDQYGTTFIPDPLRTYLFAVKTNINDTDYILEPKTLEIVDGKLTLILEKEDVPEAVLAQWEVVEIENYSEENEKEHTLYQGIFEVKGDIIRR